MFTAKLFLRKITVGEWRLARKTFLKLFTILPFAKEYWWRQILISLVAFIFVPISLINPYLTQLAVDGPLMNKSTVLFLKYGLIMGCISLVTMLAQNYITYLQNRLSEDMRHGMTKKIYARLSDMSLDYFRMSQRRNRYDSILGATGVEIFVWAMGFVPQFFVQVLIVFAKLAVVFIIDWRLGLAALLAPPLYALRASFLARRNRILERIERENNLLYGKELGESIGVMHVVKTFRTESYHKKRVHAVLDKMTLVKKKDHRFAMMFSSVSGFLFKAVDGIPALVGALLVTTRQISLGQLSAALIYLGQCAGAVSQLIDMIPSLVSRVKSVNICSEFLRLKPTVCEAPGARYVNFGAADITVENVSFSYVPDRPVLKNVSFVIRGGEWTGIKAPSGYGKTTLLSLILRLYDVQDGRVAIGGHDVRELQFKCLGEQISTVFQGIFLHREPIKKCIAYDREDASLEDVREAARLAGIDDFISSLPQGYDTTPEAHGFALSVGQMQRITIARALLRKPKILVMDEAFSSVDKETEDRIVAEMRASFPQMTVIVVSHHQSVLDKMDSVIDLTGAAQKTEEKISV